MLRLKKGNDNLKTKEAPIKPQLANEQIRIPRILVIDETGESLGELDTKQAIELAYQKGLDLVLVGPGAQPPVAKIIDFGKFKYEQEKQLKKQKKGSKKTELKEIRISLRIGAHDLEVKRNKIIDFLGQGDKVKISLVLSGREMAYKPKAFEALSSFIKSIPNTKLDTPASIERKIISAIITK